MKQYLTIKEINDRLQATRDQSFRKKTQQYIDIANNSKAHNMANYGNGTYTLRSPGNDLLDFYDEQQKSLDPTSKAYSMIPPSVVFHYRFEHDYPAELFNKSLNYGRYAYLRDQLSDYHVTKDPKDKTYWAQVYTTRFRWLINQPHKEYQFKLKADLDKFAIEHIGQKISGRLSTQKSTNQLLNEQHVTTIWRGKLAGWSVIWEAD